MVDAREIPPLAGENVRIRGDSCKRDSHRLATDLKHPCGKAQTDAIIFVRPTIKVSSDYWPVLSTSRFY